VIEDANPYAIWDKMLANVRAGDTLMTFSYALARNGRAAQRVHTEADWLNAGPGEVAGQSDERILAALKSHAERLDDPKRRADAGNDAESDARASRALYFQAHLAAERELESAAEPLLAIARSESAHWLHRKQAVLALGKIGELASLGETFSDLLLDDDGLGHFAAEALANFGPAAAPIVVEAMQRSDDASRAALHAAGLVGGDAVRARLEAVVEPDARRRSRREAYAALGQLGARGDEMAVAILIRGLESDPGVYGKAAAAEALGVAGGADAARALRSARERHAGDRSMNHLVYQINRALNRMRNQN